MPGIFGVYNKKNTNNISDLMDKMIASMCSGRDLKIDRFIDVEKGLCLGRVSLGVFNVTEQPIRDRSDTHSIIFHGELYNNTAQMSDPEYILKEYIRTGNSCATKLNGIFHFTIYDKRSNQIKLFSDKFGLQPLYYSVISDGIVFSSKIKAILQEQNISRNIDFQSFADFLHYGQILGCKTLFRDIKLLGPGSVLIYDINTSKLYLEKYWQLEDCFVKEGKYNPNVSIDDTVSVLISSIKERLTQQEHLGLSLSGGLDSRGILAGMGEKAEGISTYTLGLQGCADQKLADMMAMIGKTNHEFIELDKEYLQDFQGMAANMISLSDGMYHPHESTEMLALEYFKRDRFKILLRGHGGEIAKAALAYPVMVTSNVYACSSKEDILKHIFDITNLVIRDNDPSKLFCQSFYNKTKDKAKESLEKSCGEISEFLAPADVCIYYYINEHIRRQVVASLDIFRTLIEIRMPYVDENYIKILLQLPVSKRNNGEIHFNLIKRCMPELVRVPNSNTGAPLDAGPLRLYLTDKVKSIMQRLGIKGFRHYTEFQDWQRNVFKDSTEKIIFGSRLSDRDIYDQRQLKIVFENHMSGKKNYGHLLGTIVGLELWFREFVD